VTVPSPELASVASATRRSLLRRWLIVAALAGSAVALFVLAGWVVGQDAQARRLQDSGERAPGTVLAIDAQLVGRGNIPNGSVIVRFEVDGTPRDSSIFVGNAVTDYQRDQIVTVVYDDTDPSRVELLGVVTRGPGVPVVPPLGLGVLSLGMAIVTGRRAWKIHRAVRRGPWLAVPSRVVQVAGESGRRQGTRTLVVVETRDGELTVEPLGLGRVTPDFEPEAWIAGLDRPTMALAVPGGGHVIAVRARSSRRP
jgi:hypothetical protein